MQKHVLCDDSELLPHPKDGLADFRSRVVLEHYHHVVFWACQEQYLQLLQTQTNADTNVMNWECPETKPQLEMKEIKKVCFKIVLS